MSRSFLSALAALGGAALISCSRQPSTAAVMPAGSGAASTQTTAPAPDLPDGVTPEMVARGKLTFNNGSCVKCHGENGLGTPRGPNLTDKDWIHIQRSYPAIVNLVTTGFTKAEQRDARYQFTMNPRGGTSLSDAEIRAVAAYVWSISAR
jgi:mono/diheme cytochrome c family protein